MVCTLRISKQYGTYADVCLTLGLARLAYAVQVALHEAKKLKLIDIGASYRIELEKELDPEEVASTVQYENLLHPVKGDKTEAIAGLDWSELNFFDTKRNTETRNRYLKFQRESKREKIELADEDEIRVPDARTQNGVILTSMRHDRNHNALWKAGWEIQQHFGALAASVLKAFAESDERSQGNEIAQAAAHFKTYTGESLPAPASAVKIFLPTFVQGVNRPKADTNKVDGSGKKEEWLLLWLIAIGLFEFGTAERIKVSDNTFDWRMVLLEPKEIGFSSYREVLDKVRKHNPPSGFQGVARFDAEMSLELSKELLTHHPAKGVGEPVRRRSRSSSIKEIVSGFSGTHFGSKGQVYGVKEVFSLGLPDWIRPETAEEVENYQELLKEHLKVVRSLSVDEGNGELLSAYRDFITGSDLSQFFRFNASYADYIVKRLANLKDRFSPPRFSKEGLDLMTQSFKQRKDDQDLRLTEITENQGFQNIAQAINSATVYAGTVRDKDGNQKDTGWERIYGLAQRLSSQAGSKKDFIIEMTAFLAAYENENLRIDEELRRKEKPRRIWTTKEDLDSLIDLIEKFGSSLVANLLIAYGYAKGWGKPKEINQKDANLQEASVSRTDVA